MPKKKPQLQVERRPAVGDKALLDEKSLFGSLNPTGFEKIVWFVCDWSILPQSWRRRLRKRYARKITGPFDVIHDAMKFRLYPAENYCDRVLFGRNELPENAEHQALLSLIKPGMVFVDIGANVGTYSIFVGSKAQGNVTILALEPHPRTYQKLRFNMSANGLPLGSVHNVGVGLQRSTVSLWSDGGSNIGHTSMLKEGTSNPKISHSVEIVPLVDLLRENKIESIDLLKIDIEGYEDRALAPFFDEADQKLWPQSILIEIAHQHLWERDLMGMLEKRGYSETFRTGENRLLSR